MNVPTSVLIWIRNAPTEALLRHRGLVGRLANLRESVAGSGEPIVAHSDERSVLAIVEINAELSRRSRAAIA